MSKLAIIMRGLPGSGKSHWVKNYLATLAPELASKVQAQGYCSTDAFFYQGDKYVFDKSRLSEYHQRNLAAFIEAMTCGLPIVICDNTNLAEWEYLCYEKAAKALGYQVRFILIGDPLDAEHQKLCAQRNQHKVPLNKIRMMARQFQSF